ncbi:hypothetical protein [Nocardia xishanensis]|uniref:hypothetical protein n=1 Tax=Nocardia xishanensis TaxID=238964 RepID=UPI000833765C|nr:hypothetical protein [Nocardia xishanensis]
MTITPGLEWLTMGAKVAYITSFGYSGKLVAEATVDKVGKRDVLVIVHGRDEKFNINRTTQLHGATWLRRDSGAWSRSDYLAPHDDPTVEKYREEARRQAVEGAARDAADRFQSSPSPDAARALQAAVSRYLELNDTEQD